MDCGCKVDCNDVLRTTAEGGTIECFLGIGVPRNCDQLLPNDLLSDLADFRIDLRLDIYGNELP